MSPIYVRPFRRDDRDQLADLVNAHAAAVVPGMGVSVSTVLGDLERQPREFLTGPWVADRLTLVAEQRERVAQVERLVDYAYAQGRDDSGQDYDDYRAFLAASGFLGLTRTKRGWTRDAVTR